MHTHKNLVFIRILVALFLMLNIQQLEAKNYYYTRIITQHFLDKNSNLLNSANLKYAKAAKSYKNYKDLYNKAINHGNSDFLHNKVYILGLLDTAEFNCKEAIKIYNQFQKAIDKKNQETLHFNLNNTNKLLSNVLIMKEKMKRFYNAPPGKSMKELNR